MLHIIRLLMLLITTLSKPTSSSRALLGLVKHSSINYSIIIIRHVGILYSIEAYLASLKNSYYSILLKLSSIVLQALDSFVYIILLTINRLS